MKIATILPFEAAGTAAFPGHRFFYRLSMTIPTQLIDLLQLLRTLFTYLTPLKIHLLGVVLPLID
jgi:hypothetical protein